MATTQTNHRDLARRESGAHRFNREKDTFADALCCLSTSQINLDLNFGTHTHASPKFSTNNTQNRKFNITPLSTRKAITITNCPGFYPPTTHWNPAQTRNTPQQKESTSSIDRNTCLLVPDINFNTTDPNLWMLSAFDEWEAEESETPYSQEACSSRGSQWALLIARAADSNKERLRRSLEGDGWDFVGGKYSPACVEGEVGNIGSSDGETESSVDAEFDCVVLGVGRRDS